MLCEIIAQRLEQRLKHPVRRNADLGGSLLAHQALLEGRLDLYPEGAGTALTVLLERPADYRPDVVLERVRLEYRERLKLEWLDPLGFDDSFVVVARREQARALGLRNLSDTSRLTAGWQIAATAEFLSRPDGMPALMRACRLRLRQGPLSLKPEAVYQALREGKVDLVAGNASDPELLDDEFIVLNDDRQAFPPNPVCIVARRQALDALAGLREALAEFSGRFTLGVVRELRRRAQQGSAVEAVAAEFLRSWR